MRGITCQYLKRHRCELRLLPNLLRETKEKLGCWGTSSPACPSYKPYQPIKLPTHTELKQKARERLIRMGFSPDEIKAEYTVVVPVKLRVDMVGIKPDRKVAIECGYHVAELDRFKLLWKVFDDVIRL